jgi:hypothetical protein
LTEVVGDVRQLAVDSGDTQVNWPFTASVSGWSKTMRRTVATHGCAVFGHLGEHIPQVAVRHHCHAALGGAALTTSLVTGTTSNSAQTIWIGRLFFTDPRARRLKFV